MFAGIGAGRPNFLLVTRRSKDLLLPRSRGLVSAGFLLTDRTRHSNALLSVVSVGTLTAEVRTTYGLNYSNSGGRTYAGVRARRLEI